MNVRALLVVAALGLGLTSVGGCGGGLGPLPSMSLLPVTASRFQVSGSAIKNQIQGATATVFSLNADGSDGAAVGTGTTDGSGRFTLSLSSLPSGPVRITVTGGAYLSESSGGQVQSTSPISAVLDSVTNGQADIVVSPLTEFVSRLTESGMSHGQSFAAAHQAAEDLIRNFYGFGASVRLETLLPLYTKAAASSDPDAFRLGMVLGGLVKEGEDLKPGSPDDLIAALAADIADGVFDGKSGTTPVDMPGGSTLPSTAGTTDFESSLRQFSQHATVYEDNGVTAGDTSATVDSINQSAASSPATPPFVGLAVNSSGSITSAAFGGHQYLFVAARSKGVVVIDITDPTVAAPPTRVWSLGSKFSSGDVGGVVFLSGGPAGHPQVYVYAYGSKHYLLANAQTLASGNPSTDNPVDTEGDLAITATQPVQFSGGAAFVAGAIPFGTTICMATADGYRTFDLATGALTSVLYPVDAGAFLCENPGGDVLHHRMLCGNYNDLQLIDVSQTDPAKAVSSIDGTTFNTLFGVPYMNGNGIDGNSVDGAYQVGVLTFEDTADVGLINLGTAGTAGGKLTPAASNGVAHVQLATAGTVQFSGSNIDFSSRHLVMFMGGYSTDVAVGELEDPATASAGQWKGLTDWRYFNLVTTPGLLPNYQFAQDPHAAGVVFNQKTGIAYGYLLDGAVSPTGVVQLDLPGLMGTTPAGASGDALHQPASIPAGAVREFTF